MPVKIRLNIFALISLALLASAFAQSEREAQITEFQVAPADDQGIFKYAYATSNGIEVQAAGSPLESIGVFSYTSPEGVPIEVRYIADELGFHAVGRHLPRPPPIPDYILRSIEYIKSHSKQKRSKWSV
ncbi:pupal cuticle protein Edg-78E [Stomoxys calcitrans]|uniref:pupal cuticle protein Edg-78E n=1 Tax=Stomoxys calcitrans TaxID=35570 RepID=UPI0027E32569|nr:pupal cuticle protein Edg-78E [Stomoxys calcitrans]